jgi:hypothetical protein
MQYFQTLRTYRAVDEVVAAFARGSLSFLVLTGNPGIGKTNRFRRMVGDNALIVDCTASAFGVYGELARNPDCDFLVLDDVDGLWSDRRGMTLLKSLGQSDGEKIVAWNTMAADREGLPRKLSLHCRVMLLANHLQGGGANLEAVLDRAQRYQFLPTAEEVHEQVRGWIEQNEMRTVVERQVFDFVGEYLPLILQPSFRFYVKASELARAGLDWQVSLMAEWSADTKLSAAGEIIRLAVGGDSALATAEQRAKRFRDAGHGCRSTYMRYQAMVFKLKGWTRLPGVAS